MYRINRDTIVAVVLLLVCGGLAWASLDIREPDYGTLKPSTWPRIILAALGFLSAIYLVQSIRQGPDEVKDEDDSPAGFAAFLSHWRNVIVVFVLFLGYLLILPWTGMLLAGTAFVFLILTALGAFSLRDMAIHAAIAVASVGGMWLIFTHALGVLLPRGELTGF